MPKSAQFFADDPTNAQEIGCGRPQTAIGVPVSHRVQRRDSARLRDQHPGLGSRKPVGPTPIPDASDIIATNRVPLGSA